MEFQGQRITVMGLGHFGGGVAAARWLARRGARVTVTDRADRATLSAALAALRGEPIERFHLGGHRQDDFRDTDMVVVNPAVRPGDPFLQVARDADVALETEVGLFLSACPARQIGVTGTNGKSTTTAMTASILRAAGCRVWAGGNIGGSLLDEVHRMTTDDWVALELSSFQLHRLGDGFRSPEVAVVTNCGPNHLDWHGNYQHYVASKQRLLLGQTADDLVVAPPSLDDNPSWQASVRGCRASIVTEAHLPPLLVGGEHNRSNAALAGTVAREVGCSNASIERGLAEFRGLPGRLETVATIAGRRFLNDTTATTPESTVAALGTVSKPVWLLAGGSDKGAPFDALAESIVAQAAGAAFFGQVRQTLLDHVRALSPKFPCVATETINEAFTWAWDRSHSGDTVLLSPACASVDQYQNFRRRGEAFVELVSQL